MMKLLNQQGLQDHTKRSDTKHKLQLQLSSKQLTSGMGAALLGHHTEEAYKTYQIPLLSTEDAKIKLKAMKEFTKKWHNKALREAWP